MSQFYDLETTNDSDSEDESLHGETRRIATESCQESKTDTETRDQKIDQVVFEAFRQSIGFLKTFSLPPA